METKEKQDIIKGGGFIINEVSAQEIFVPEEFSEEQKMMAQACQDFIEMEILPNIERIEKLEEGMMSSLVQKAGELGLLGISVPEELGGLGMDFNTSMLMADIIGAAGSFSTAYGAHTGIGTLPILLYGTEDQKKKYVPNLATGIWKASYCLTEPNAGSDANSGKTKAVLSDDGKHYLITGQKMWISNAGFADIFIVFAKIEDDKNLTAFIVEKDFNGITMNDEEHKLGIKGSSTRQVFFTDTKVPVENMLSDRQNGFKIAVNILNVGRVKLGAGVIGGCKDTITKSVSYANDRKQFGTSISSFGAIQYKLAEMATKTFVTESASYRAGQDIEDAIQRLKSEGLSDSDAKLKGVEEFAIECAIIKILGSESLDYVVDEGVQIYGGMGFSEEAPMARGYRDARIARIYEGTNEINRMLLVGMLIKRGMKGQLDVMGPAMAVGKELTAVPSFASIDTSKLFAAEKEVIKNLKKVVLMIAGKAAMKFGTELTNQQEILMNVADIIIDIYGAESAILRAEKVAHSTSEEASKDKIDMAKLYLSQITDKANIHGKEAINAFSEGDEQKVMLMGLKRFTKSDPVNSIALRRSIAASLIKENKYCF